MDTDFNVSATGVWTLSLSHDIQGEFSINTDTIFYAGGALAPTGNRTSRPAGSQWDFIGTTAGSPIWFFGQTQSATPNSVWPGLSTEQTPASYLGTWDPATPLVGSGRWLELSLVSMEYHGTGAVNNFSMWTTGTFGTPTAWMSTANGITAVDAYPMVPGGHSHMNWGFTSEGVYDLTFIVRTYLADGTLTESDPFTTRFGINATSVAPEPGRMLLMTVAMGAMALRRRREGK